MNESEIKRTDKNNIFIILHRSYKYVIYIFIRCPKLNLKAVVLTK